MKSGDLYGATIGIIGNGAIGQGTAAIARGFGMRVIFSNYHPSSEDNLESVPFKVVLAQSDILSLHCPMTPETRDMIGINELRKIDSVATPTLSYPRYSIRFSPFTIIGAAISFPE